MPLDPATVAHRWFEEAWNQGSERAIDELHVTVEDTITQGEKVQSASSSKPPISAKVWACLRAMRA